MNIFRNINDILNIYHIKVHHKILDETRNKFSYLFYEFLKIKALLHIKQWFRSLKAQKYKIETKHNSDTDIEFQNCIFNV